MAMKESERWYLAGMGGGGPELWEGLENCLWVSICLSPPSELVSIC